jgi:transcriptional regulator with XRE-family HTH domain
MENEMNERLLVLLKKMGITQKEFCETAGISLDTLNSTFQEGNSPSIDLLKLLAENLPAHSISWLLTGKGEPACSSPQHSSNNNGIGIIGNNVHGGGINDNQSTQEMIQLLKKKDEQMDILLQILQEINKTNNCLININLKNE